MMKKLFALAVAGTVVLLLPTFAGASENWIDKPNVSGTITAWDDATKQATIKDSAGKEISFGWNEKALAAGTPKVGELASVAYTTDKDGKNWATHVRIAAKPEGVKPPASK
jgi:hypothetical protein